MYIKNIWAYIRVNTVYISRIWDMGKSSGIWDIGVEIIIF